MRMTHAQMYARILASDAGFNGRFFTGVLSTGIYCLPSCRARKPKPGNVRFFPTCEAARAAGLRACRKCHPDDFARGADPVLEAVEGVVAEVRAAPWSFADARAVVERSGFGTTRAFELFRTHFHATPADLLLRARLDHAKQRLLGSSAPLAAVAGDAGFESLSVFHRQFRAHNGLTPSAFRGLGAARGFRLALPGGYPLDCLRRALGRDPQSVSERLQGPLYRAGVRLDGLPALLRMEIGAASVSVSVEVPGGGRLPSLAAAHEVAAGLLGLGQDAEAFARLARRLGHPRLVAGRSGMRVCQTPSVFDGLVWAIIGQQVDFQFACTLRRRLIERSGTPVGGGLLAPPDPAAIAALEPAELLAMKFSHQKAGYLSSLGRLVAGGGLDLGSLRSLSATRVERLLLNVRGLGPWSVNYVMMRSLALADCVPLGDTGVASGLAALFHLAGKPDRDATIRLMAPFSPHRSLATAHLWQLGAAPLPPS
jgi:AraC family transcriptional regulator of adaptative response / DNA-3-methyladenine glycosylase II